MTVLFHDVHMNVDHMIAGRGFEFYKLWELLYADDTLLISTSTRAINEKLAAVEKWGERYGLQLNKKKVEYMASNKDPKIHFRNGQPVKRVQEVKYLGVNLNIQGDIKK